MRQNAYSFLLYFQPLTQNPVKLKLAQHIQDKIGHKGLDRVHIRVAHAIGVLPYLKRSHVKDFFVGILKQMQKVGTHWSAFNLHGELLRSFQEVGGLTYCPDDIRADILKWMALTYIGEPGGMTRYGTIRHVFYSDTASPLIRDIIKASAPIIQKDLKALSKDKDITRMCQNKHVARRFQDLMDMVTE